MTEMCRLKNVVIFIHTILNFVLSRKIVKNLWTKFVSNLFPESQGDFSYIMGEMDSGWQFPFAFSAIDRSYIPVKCSPSGPEAMKQYHNFKNFYSVILFALVDPTTTIISYHNRII